MGTERDIESKLKSRKWEIWPEVTLFYFTYSKILVIGLIIFSSIFLSILSLILSCFTLLLTIILGELNKIMKWYINYLHSLTTKKYFTFMIKIYCIKYFHPRLLDLNNNNNNKFTKLLIRSIFSTYLLKSNKNILE